MILDLSKSSDTPFYPCHHCGYSNADSPTTCPECGQSTSRQLSQAQERKPINRRWIFVGCLVVPLFLLQVSFIVWSQAWNRLITPYWVGVLFGLCSMASFMVLYTLAPPILTRSLPEDRTLVFKFMQPVLWVLLITFVYIAAVVAVSLLVLLVV